MTDAPFAGRVKEPPWARDTAAFRWYGFGRYYAMFPASFAYDAVRGLTDCGDLVLDPFCGRGNGPFTAGVLGRPSVGVDINPVAWIFASVKLEPEMDEGRLLRRLDDVARSCRSGDRKSRSRFETMAWSPDVRAFLRAARRELDWRHSVTDRTLMAFVALHMQDQIGAGLSNCLWPTIACSAEYAVSWWSRNGFHRPPDVEPVALLTKKIRWRYRYGTPNHAAGCGILLSDACVALREMGELDAGLLLTSPPYSGLTDYWNDHWIRLWILGHKMRKDWKRSAKYENLNSYRELIFGVFRECRRHLMEGASILVRSDRRRRTASICVSALQEIWPDCQLHIRESASPHKGISVHHGRGGSSAREMDFLIPGEKGKPWRKANGFVPWEGERGVRLAGEAGLSGSS